MQLEGIKDHPKIKLAEDIKEKEAKLNSTVQEDIILNSFVMVKSKFSSAFRRFRSEFDLDENEMRKDFKEKFSELNMIFIDKKSEQGRKRIKIMDKLFRKILD